MNASINIRDFGMVEFKAYGADAVGVDNFFVASFDYDRYFNTMRGELHPKMPAVS